MQALGELVLETNQPTIDSALVTFEDEMNKCVAAQDFVKVTVLS